MTTVAVTGGTGFIGSRLALAHQQAGDTTRIFAAVKTAAESQAVKELRDAGVEVCIGDITSGDDVRTALCGVDVVYHLAAAQHEAGVPDDYFYRINVDGTRTLFNAAAEQNVRHVIHGSTIGVYGMVENGTPVNEDSAVLPDNIYGVTKLKGEEIAREQAARVPTTIIRISETYGPGDFRLLKMFKGVRRGRFPLIGDGRNVHQLIYVDDLIVGMQNAATRQGTGRTYLLGGNERITTNEMVEQVRAAVGARFAGPRVPAIPMVLAARLCELTFAPLGMKPPLHRRRLDFFRKSFLLDCSRAAEEIDFEPSTCFAVGAERTAAWYLKRGLV